MLGILKQVAGRAGEASRRRTPAEVHDLEGLKGDATARRGGVERPVSACLARPWRSRGMALKT